MEIFPPLQTETKKGPFLDKRGSKFRLSLTQGRQQDFGWGGQISRAKRKIRFARSATKILNFAPRKTYFAPLKSTFCLIIS